MMTMKAIPIGELDRRNPTERWLDDLLKRYATPDFKTFDVFASTTELLEAYLAVVRRRNKIYRWSRIGDVYELEAQALAYISVKTQNKIIQSDHHENITNGGAWYIHLHGSSLNKHHLTRKRILHGG